MEVTCSSETSADFQRTTRRYISEDGTLQLINCWVCDWDPIQETVLGPIQPRTYWGLGFYHTINHSLRSTWVNKKFWEELIVKFSLIHVPHKKRNVQQLFYCCVCIRCSGNVLREPLPSNDGGIHFLIHRLIGGIYIVRCWDGLRRHDIHTKFHKDWFKQTPWPESASELYRPSNRRLSAKLVPTLADRGCCVVSTTNSHGREFQFSRPEPLLSFK
jgi:hypothetical protein